MPSPRYLYELLAAVFLTGLAIILLAGLALSVGDHPSSLVLQVAGTLTTIAVGGSAAILHFHKRQ